VAADVAAPLPLPARIRAKYGREALWLVGPCAVYLLIFSIYPLVYSLRQSFTDQTGSSAHTHWVWFQNYGRLFHDAFFWNAAENSAIIVGASVAVEVVLGVALALFFNLRLRGSSIVRGLLVLPMLITPIVVGVMWRALLNPDWGLANWLLGRVGSGGLDPLDSTTAGVVTMVIADAWQWTPFVFLIVFARLQALPADVFEAASVDGATAFGRLRRLTLPLLAPAITIAAVFRAIDGFRSFDLVYGLTYGGPARATTTLGFFAYQQSFEFQNYSYAAAVAYIMVIVLVVASTLVFRFARPRRVDAL
jgi:multiple sugar transport system permease protein